MNWLKKIVFLSCLMIVSFIHIPQSIAQNFLNGDFEINTCSAGVDQINLSNIGFNGFMSNTFAFGTFGDMDIITTATYQGLPQSGSWYVAFTGGGTDAIAMQLSSPLTIGNTYSICFYDRASANFTPMPVQVGVSTTNNSMGTIVYTAGAAATVGVWTQRTFTFVAPIAATYITVQTTGALGNWTQTDNFSFCCSANVALGNDTTICTGNSLNLDAGNPGGTYLWSTGATTQTITVNTTGNYWVTATVLSCTATDSIHIDVVNPPVVNLGNDTIFCAANNLNLNAGNVGVNFLWNTGATTQTINVNVTGSYWVIASVGACADTDTVSITFAPVISVNLGLDIVTCIGLPVTLDAGNAGFSFLWNNGATTQTITPTTTGMYSVTVTSGNCSNADTVNVIFNSIPAVNLGPDQSLCNIPSITLNANNSGAIYLWSNGSTSQTITIFSSGQYWVQVSNGTCVGSDTINIIGDTPPNVNLGPDLIGCEGTIFTIDAGSPGLTYSWNNGETTQTISVSNSNTYAVTISNGPCIGIDTVVVIVYPLPYVFIGKDTSICSGDQITLDAGKGFLNYSWSPFGGNMHFMIINQPNTYVVTVEDTNGCINSNSIWIRDFCPSNMYVPNAFTPNKDLQNDIFNVQCENVIGFHLYIFNRWGELVFESQDIAIGWDGTYGGNDAPEGIYCYQIDYQLYEFYSLQKHTKAGKLALIR